MDRATLTCVGSLVDFSPGASKGDSRRAAAHDDPTHAAYTVSRNPAAGNERMSAAVPFVSIVVPTRNRPRLLQRALDSIAGQSCPDFEAIVVDDGSAGDALQAMRSLASRCDSRFRFVWREPGSARHGPAAARNAGIDRAAGRYVAFLDDDDYWSDPGHLASAHKALMECPDADLYLADQVALQGKDCVVPHWLPHLERIAPDRPCVSGPDVRAISHRDLLQPGGIGFAHVNISIVRRDTLARVGGFWEETAYEEDLDFFLRLADASARILYRSSPVAVNTVRDASDTPGASNLGEESRLLFRMLDCQHALLACRRPEVIAYTRKLLGGTLKTLAKRCHAAGRLRLASEFAFQAAGIDRGPRWIGIALYLRLRALASKMPGTA